MKTITKTIEVYEFNELSEEAKDKAIKEHVDYLIDIDWNYEEYIPGYVQEAMERSEEMETPWFFGQYIYQYGQEYIVQELQDHDFLITGEQYFEN